MGDLSVDEKYMKIALSLAKKGIGWTSPNPAVGAVLVKNKKVIASAYHKRAGLMHAEAAAIIKAGSKACGATLYGTLEACAHHGRTPPCTDAIIKSGIKRAVFAMRDPNPVNHGLGIARLRRAGIETGCGVLRREAMDLNEPFAKFMKKGVPYVTLKIAQSIDGKIADAKGRSRWITSEASRRLVHRLRARNDAVMIGVNTLLKDDPSLTSRAGGKTGKQPVRVIVDTDLRTPLRSRIFKNGNKKGGKVVIAAGNGAPLKRRSLLEREGATVILLPRKAGRVDAACLLRHLAKMGIVSVLCEGGGELSASLIKSKLVDEAFFFIAPRIMGGKAAPTSCGGMESDIRKMIRIKNPEVRRIGQDILVKGTL